MLNLDSDHAAPHVLSELPVVADLVRPGCYLIVEDTAMRSPLGERLLPGPAEALEEWMTQGRPFRDRTDAGEVPLTAVRIALRLRSRAPSVPVRGSGRRPPVSASESEVLHPPGRAAR